MIDSPKLSFDTLYDVIMMFAGGKRYLMRTPLRLWAEIGWETKHGTNSRASGKGGKSSSEALKNALRKLERKGLIRRFPGGIEIMENR